MSSCDSVLPIWVADLFEGFAVGRSLPWPLLLRQPGHAVREGPQGSSQYPYHRFRFYIKISTLGDSNECVPPGPVKTRLTFIFFIFFRFSYLIGLIVTPFAGPETKGKPVPQ
jgi:hypothetical protein